MFKITSFYESAEFDSIHQGIIFTDELHLKLRKWVKKYYENNLIYDDLFVPAFILKCKDSLSELSRILNIDQMYPFQIK